MTMQGAAATTSAARRTTPWLAGTTWLLSVAIIVAGGMLAFLNDRSASFGSIFYTLVLLAFATVGALVTLRHPENLIGWLLGWGTLLTSLGDLALEYAVYTLLTVPRSLPGGEWMLWFGAWIRSLGFFTLIVFVPLLFPDGRVPTARWRPFARFAVIAVVFFTIVIMLSPANQSELRLPPLPSPLGITILPGLYGPLTGLSFLGIAVSILGVAVSVIFRFRGSEGEEREQLKWFAYAGVLSAVVFAVILFGVFALPPDIMLRFGGVLFSILLAGFPIAIGIAILKYRLYEIDLLINRTLVYVPLTAILAGIFAASITLSQKLFVAITGEKSDAATVLTTLVVVALFEPLKTGLQRLVELRFKEPANTAKVWKAYGDELTTFAQMVDVEASLRRLLNEAVNAFGATGGRVEFQKDSHSLTLTSAVDWHGAPSLTIPLSGPKENVRIGTLSLGARRDGRDYSEKDRESLQATAAVVARVIAFTQRTDSAGK